MNQFSSLTVLEGILEDPLIRAFASDDRTQFLRLLYASGKEEHFAKHLADVVLTDANAFSRACAAGKNPSELVRRAYASDLKKIKEAMSAPEDGFF